ncbi:MAG: NAD(P)/FAD-dependent oxidoreductase [Christensenellales bacterium]
MTDVLIIGGGAAGMTAALYALRNGKSVTVFEQETIGGQIASSPRVENFPTHKRISGLELSEKLYDQITDLGAELELARVKSVIKEEEGKFRLETEDGDVFYGKSVIIAAGVKHKHINLPREEEFTGKGVSYCAVCDGAFYTGEDVALIGDGNTALQYGILLSEYCRKVYVCTWFDKFFGDEALVKVLRKIPNVEIIPNVSLSALNGDEELSGLTFTRREDNTTFELSVKGCFIAIGQIPDNKAFENLVALDENGYIAADETGTTKTSGVYAAGDCRAKKVRQLTTAVGDGANAAMNACSYIAAL